MKTDTQRVSEVLGVHAVLKRLINAFNKTDSFKLRYFGFS